jgi:hypothetical protein
LHAYAFQAVRPPSIAAGGITTKETLIGRQRKIDWPESDWSL